MYIYGTCVETKVSISSWKEMVFGRTQKWGGRNQSRKTNTLFGLVPSGLHPSVTVLQKPNNINNTNISWTYYEQIKHKLEGFTQKSLCGLSDQTNSTFNYEATVELWQDHNWSYNIQAKHYFNKSNHHSYGILSLPFKIFHTSWTSSHFVTIQQQTSVCCIWMLYIRRYKALWTGLGMIDGFKHVLQIKKISENGAKHLDLSPLSPRFCRS